MKHVLGLLKAILLAVAVFIGVYVVYAHVASFSEARRYARDAEVFSFPSASALLAAYDVRKEGALDYAVHGGRLHITGRTTVEGGRPARLELVSHERRLEDARLSLRFRTGKPGAYDVMVGYESDHTGKGPAAVRYGFHDDVKDAGFGWGGDSLTSLGSAQVVTEAPEALAHQRWGRPSLKGVSVHAGDAGDGAAGEAGESAPLHAAGEWHEVRLEMSPSLHQAFATVDGLPAGTVSSEWMAGAPVRIVFGVVAREPGQDVDVEIEQVAYEPVRGPELALAFDDKFDGKFIDPRRWHVQQADTFWMEASARTSPNGLVLAGRALKTTTVRPGVVLHSPTFALSSVHLRVRVHLEQLDDSGFFVGLTSSLGGALLRTFDVGVLGEGPQPDGRSRRRAFAAGHWKHDGQSRLQDAATYLLKDDVLLQLDYDAATRIGRARIDDQTLVEEKLDLQPREEVRVRFGVNVHAEDSKYRVDVRELSLTALQD